ncbi:LL-diaminopimelate aminotransferase [Anoxybacter fermentans]|uniref:LL-diaminopimelate aminotransferase n=1 Tax=Anoxybacter fermentans TaxID=1323375 RepID=A0A3S9SWS6_9FIRM|nr:LL-diaminopimelate aminotransferase [Anoxybacter fermentans]AZR72796.1 LL-diaminopimelate aminotransferase [Anoxybacter fermentans]
MELAQRVQNLPPYLFAEIDAMIAEAKAKKVDVISFGIGDPDQPTPRHIVNKAIEAIQDPNTHSYPSYIGMYSFRKAIADFYQKRFGVSLDPDKEVLALIGTKEGIAHLPWCILNPGDIALVPDPAYPVYKTATILCNATPYMMPLLKENDFLPDLDEIDHQIAKKAKLMFLNYPNNPTGAVATREFFEEVIQFAYEYDIIVAHDAAYSEIAFDGYQPLSILEIPRAKEIAVEFYSLSKTYNMTGWRIGALVGNAEIVNALGRIKTNVDSGIFEAVQYAGIEALTGPQNSVDEINDLYKRRRDLVLSYLKELGWPVQPNKATFYVWLPVPKGYTSEEFSKEVFKKTGVFFTPGIGYGKYGEGYVRLSLTVSEDRIKEAFQRIKDSGIRYSS